MEKCMRSRLRRPKGEESLVLKSGNVHKYLFTVLNIFFTSPFTSCQKILFFNPLIYVFFISFNFDSFKHETSGNIN